MKAKFFLYSLAVSALILFSSYTFVVGDKEQVLVQSMMRIMMYYHYQPQQIDDDFSQKVFDSYIESLDYNKRFFLQNEIDNLSLYRDRIDEELKNETFEFFELSHGIINHRIEESEKYVMEFLKEPFDYSKKEGFDTDVENKAYAESESEIKDRWRKELKYKAIVQISSALEREKTEAKAAEDNGEPYEKKSFEEIEAEVRQQVVENYKKYFERLSKIKKTDRQADYFNTIASTFDPHTNYYPPRQKEKFDQNITGRFEGIGASLITDDEGYIKVVQIIPGSASARQGELQPNDRILKVAQKNEDPVNVVGMDMQEAISMIKGPKGTEVQITVRKPDGSEKVIPIVRDIVELEETYAKSTTIRDKNSEQKFGFIHLPGFYADFTRSGGRNCAEDVANELVKLKREGVDGVILDLRNNGGGSLGEVVEMAGLFIKNGPIVQIKSRDGDVRVMKDRNPTVTYDGKLIILVNSFSASASEILAAAIQDYDRGLIVGSSSTYGKGTVQRFLDLDDVVPRMEEIKPLGQIKLTTQKYYRIDGGATQLKGVIPDVVLPDVYNLLEIGEKEQDQAMEWDEIKPARYDAWANPVSDDLTKVLAHSQARIDTHTTFSLIAENALRYKERNERSTYPLNLDDYQAYREEVEREAEKYKGIAKPIAPMEIAYLSSDKDFIYSDTTRLQRYQNWHRALKKDVYVYEAIQIMKDID